MRLRQLQGLALARSGANARARQLFEKLRAENDLDEETLGMLARTYKDDATLAKTPREARKFLSTRQRTSTRLNGGYGTGFNAATTALLVEKKTEAAKLDPVTRKRGYGGTHVSRAARIEPCDPCRTSAAPRCNDLDCFPA